jgi:Glycosyl hydrolase family 26
MSRNLSRRHLLALTALAALPAAACGSPRTGEPTTDGLSADAPWETPASSAPVTVGGGPVAFRNGRVLLGAYVALRGLSVREGLALRRKQLGRNEKIVHRFFSWTDAMPRSLSAVPDGSTLLISWRGPNHSEITDGSSDKLIAAAARRLAAEGKPTLLRWGWDMNRDFYRWGGAANGKSATGYVQSWKRLHRIFDEEGADNISWVWSPNWNSSPDATWNQIQNYYPGDDYVDWIGVSGYAENQTPGQMFDNFYDEYATRKPIMISEVAVVDHGGRTKADWIASFAAWVKTKPAVGAVVWFDTDTHPGSTEKWRIDSDKQALAAYKAMADDPIFAG